MLPFHACSLLVYICEPVVDFTTLHPFDFDRNLLIFLLCPFYFFSEVQFKYHARTEPSLFHHWFSFLLLMAFLYFKLVAKK